MREIFLENLTISGFVHVPVGSNSEIEGIVAELLASNIIQQLDANHPIVYVLYGNPKEVYTYEDGIFIGKFI